LTNVNPETIRHEKEVEKFLTKLGFDPIMSNEIIKDGKLEIGEIDSLFEYKDYLFIVEVSTKKKQDNQKKNFFFSKWSDGYNLRKLRKKYKLSVKKTVRVYFDKVTMEPENHKGLDHITKRRKGNKVVYADKYEEFKKDLKKDPVLARKHFLEWIKTDQN
jgi:Holliday junction resolvase-like predicted endonuclease